MEDDEDDKSVEETEPDDVMPGSLIKQDLRRLHHRRGIEKISARKEKGYRL